MSMPTQWGGLDLSGRANIAREGGGRGATGGRGPNVTGRQGEIRVRGTQNVSTKITIRGRNRVPDRYNKRSRSIGEVKNVRYQHYSSQLRDMTDWASSKGWTFTLYVRRNTKLSAEVKRQIAAKRIRKRFIPGT